MKKLLKKLACLTMALTATCACAATFTACETDYPEVTLEIEFDGEVYELEYKLYRKVAPSTVNHFLKLVENGYYDGVCVHDYDAASSKLVTGAYTYTAGADNGGLVYKNYYDIVKTYENFPHTVWADEAQQTPTYTLYGEFSDNGFSVKKGITDNLFGSLSMYYTSKTTSEDKVSVKRADGDGYSNKQYKYNSATSAFAVSIDEAEKAASSNYCTFATLDEDSQETLKELLAAVEAYIADAYGEEGKVSDFVTKEDVPVDQDDVFVGENEEEVIFSIPNKEIQIKKVTVKKY
jgi:cyclophilin family peptidyl-prolyl cis-trans isomerase